MRNICSVDWEGHRFSINSHYAPRTRVIPGFSRVFVPVSVMLSKQLHSATETSIHMPILAFAIAPASSRSSSARSSSFAMMEGYGGSSWSRRGTAVRYRRPTADSVRLLTWIASEMSPRAGDLTRARGPYRVCTTADSGILAGPAGHSRAPTRVSRLHDGQDGQDGRWSWAV